MKPTFARPKLSAAAISALREGRKIDAIKIVREEYGIGLNDAMEVVIHHARNDPGLQSFACCGSVEGTIERAELAAWRDRARGTHLLLCGRSLVRACVWSFSMGITGVHHHVRR